ncbi:MAG: phosphopantothenoylcysteine decarboxylase [Verrucomicrobiota bacterium]
MKVLVTCGPSAESIDKVRQITNFSTGELGILLCNTLAQRGHDVTCFMGQARTCADKIDERVDVRFFTSVQNLKEQWKSFPARDSIDVIFHAAALADYTVKAVLNSQGTNISQAKISSGEHDEILIHCARAEKLIAQLKHFFSKALLVGWKYEKEGTPEQGIQKAFQQIAQYRTDACVLNGDVVGEGFVFCRCEGRQDKLQNKRALAQFLTQWVEQQIKHEVSV